MQTWDYLLKQMLWKQLDFVQGMRILDFGSGAGDTAAHLGIYNDVTAVEPSVDMQTQRKQGEYTQLQGGIELVKAMPAASFDLVLCHNVLEILSPRIGAVGKAGWVHLPGEHNRPGRVMQMAVLLNNFDMANTLLDGGNGTTANFGDIRYYEDADALRWLSGFTCEKCWGARTFWDLQQKQECHTDAAWQQHMLALEERVSTIPQYQNIAFFHHLLIKKADV